ncbi:MAG: glycosyltransferase family 2 protein [Chloroflexota bacterium]
MSGPQSTIVIVPRERFSHSERSLQNLYENTKVPFDLVYVSAGAPVRLQKYLDAQAEQKGFHLLRSNRYLSPNQARNLGLSQVHTKYVVFLDNDALVRPGWLDALVRCAEETDAWVVGPVYFLGEFERQIVHMAGGLIHIREQDGERIFYEEQHYFNTPLAEVRRPLRRQTCGHLEFHCLLVRTDVFNRLGPLDEGLLSVHEHLDFCLAVNRAGGSVYLEPKSVTTYIPPPPCEWSDLPFFMLRWSDEWTLATAHHFNEKWGIVKVLHITDQSNSALEDTVIRFARGHRRLMTGLRINDKDVDRPESPLEQAELMLAMFLSVDRDRFDLALTAADGSVIQATMGLGPQRLLERLQAALQEADEKNLVVMFRPVAQGRSRESAIVRVDDLDPETARRVSPYAMVTLETMPQIYQCWFAVDTGNWRSEAALRPITPATSRGRGEGYCSVAGGHAAATHRGLEPHSYQPRLVSATAGLLNTVSQLDAKGLLPYLAGGVRY